MPVIASTVAVALVWRWIYHADFGLLNSALYALGVTDPPSWLSSTTWALPAVIMMSIWQQIGFSMVLFLAGLQGVPQTLYEAARIDGTNTIVFNIYRYGFQFFQMGYAAAMAWVLFALIFIVTVVQFRYQRNWVHYD